MSEVQRPIESQDPRVRAALEDYFRRIDAGESVDRERFLAAHPQIAPELRSFLATAEQLERIAGASRRSDRSRAAPPEKSTHSVLGRDMETAIPRGVQDADRRSASAEGLPERFGRYHVQKPLGRGAMGMVFLAEDTQLHRRVALKTPSFDQDDTGELLERFYREARAAADIRHPNICPVYDVGEIDGRHYISMAYIEGRPLSAFMEGGKQQSERQSLRIVAKLALALQEAHDKGVVHRDLKPANIMIDGRGEPIIMDFGLARKIKGEDEVRLTQSGTLVGSPAYMSPEQVEGNPDKIGPATDQYALGVILYEMLSGTLPFRGTMTAVIGQILTKDAPPLSESRTGLDPRTESLVRKMMSRSPADRYPSLKAAAHEISSIAKTLTSGGASASKVEKSPARSDDIAIAGAAGSAAAGSDSGLAALSGAAQICLARHDYDQAVAMLEQIPEAQRTAEIRALLDKARGLSDEVEFLLSEIDDAVRRKNEAAALQSAERLHQLSPGHRRVREVQQRFGRGGASSFVRRLRRTLGQAFKGRDPFWPALAVGALAFLILLGGVVLYVRSGDAVMRVTINDPNLKVGLEGETLTLDAAGGPVKVTPGTKALTISYGDATFTSPNFTLRKGENPAVVVELLGDKIAAKFGETLLQEWPNPLTAGEKSSTPQPENPATGVPRRTVVGTRVPAGAAGKENFALEFDGTDDRVEIAGLAWDGTPPLTIEAWIDSPLDAHRPIAIAGYKGQAICRLQALGARNPQQFARWLAEVDGAQDGTAVNIYSTHAPPFDERPWHIAIVVGEHKLRLFENGKPVGERMPSRPWSTNYNATGIELGARFDFGGVKWADHFRGTLDEVRISKSERYTGEFTPPRRHTADADTIALYHFDDASGDVLTDASGNGHHGKIVGAKWVKFESEFGPTAGARPPLAIAPFDAAQAREAQLAWAKYLDVPVEFENANGMKFILIPPGENVRGSTSEQIAEMRKFDRYSELAWYESEQPQHRVRITTPFYLGVTEVTRDEFERFVTATEYKTESESSTKGAFGYNPELGKFERKELYSWRNPGFDQTGDHPVVNVTWNDANAFCRWLNTQVDGYRLPTDAEWEYAARGGTTTILSTGDSIQSLEGHANVLDPSAPPPLKANPVLPQAPFDDGFAFTAPVGALAANPFQLFDMQGNVREWCLDGFDPLEFSRCENMTVEDPFVPPESRSKRVVRNGSFLWPIRTARPANRGDHSLEYTDATAGFRVAASIDVGRAHRNAVAAVPTVTADEVVEVESPIPEDAVEHEGRWYKLYHEQVSWTKARERCVAMGGRLPIVRDAAHNAFLAKLLTDGVTESARQPGIWLGASDAAKEGDWRWNDGAPLTYTNWGPMQPNNKQGGEHYAVLWLPGPGGGAAGIWSDQPDTSVQHTMMFVCEWLPDAASQAETSGSGRSGAQSSAAPAGGLADQLRQQIRDNVLPLGEGRVVLTPHIRLINARKSDDTLTLMFSVAEMNQKIEFERLVGLKGHYQPNAWQSRRFTVTTRTHSETLIRRGLLSIEVKAAIDSREELKWQTLFDGRTLNGWKAPINPQVWSARNGVIACNGAVKGGWLVTEREYADFEFEFEYKLSGSSQSNSGVFLRAPDTGDPTGKGFLEIQLINDAAPRLQPVQKTGAIYGIVPPMRPTDSSVNRWHKMRIAADGPKITVWIDDKEVTAARLDEYPQVLRDKPDVGRPSGRIGFQNYGEQVEFRNVRIRELSPPEKR